MIAKQRKTNNLEKKEMILTTIFVLFIKVFIFCPFILFSTIYDLIKEKILGIKPKVKKQEQEIKKATNKTIIYSPELFYFDKEGYVQINVLKKAILVTAQEISQWSKYYEATLAAPKKGIKKTIKQGELPSDREERKVFIGRLINWIFENSQSGCQDLFALFLDTEPIGKRKGSIAKFDHHDDTDCWALNLSGNEFRELQAAWRKNNLPEDLFYPHGKGRCIDVKPFKDKKGLFFDLLNILLGWQRCYTPQEWENRKKS